MSESEAPQGEALRALLRERRAPGRLVWIGVRPERGAPMLALNEATLITDRGVQGDRASARSPGGKRQVSLVQAEHLPVVAGFVGGSDVAPELLRRNLVIAGINVIGLRASTFRIGDVLLRGNGPCEPCSKMERALGQGGYNAMRGHGGILAVVLRGGTIRVGDEVDFWRDGAPL
ncbi:MAG TPA: MOSC domain-containing protein [Polyangiales bacterium]